MKTVTFCKQCGNVLNCEFRFCPFCGNRHQNREMSDIIDKSFADLGKVQSRWQLRQLNKLEKRLEKIEAEINFFLQLK